MWGTKSHGRDLPHSVVSKSTLMDRTIRLDTGDNNNYVLSNVMSAGDDVTFMPWYDLSIRVLYA